MNDNERYCGCGHMEKDHWALGCERCPCAYFWLPEEDEDWKRHDQTDYAILADYYEEKLKRNA